MGKQQPLVLLVDDEPDLCKLMQMSLSRMGIKTHMAHHLKQAKDFFGEYRYDACITDFNLPDGNGLELIRFVTQNYPKTPIAVLTAYANMELAISALKSGAFDFVSKPINQQHLQQLVLKALHIPPVDQSQGLKPLEETLLMGESEQIIQLRESIKKIARSQAPVFITGESGTGKEVVAKLIHQLSNREDGPFVTINCGAISEELLETELFGHTKGSFSGATEDKLGLIQAADSGSLFLDEIAELSLPMQAKLLRAVQEKKIRPFGSEIEIDIDFRVISASHQNLEDLVQQGKFRQDLFFRIHVMDLFIAPLRERQSDILILAQHFIQKICTEWSIESKTLTDEAKQFLLQHHFSGNVRELKNMLERAITLTDDVRIDRNHFAAPKSKTSHEQPLSTHMEHKNDEQAVSTNAPSKIPEEGLEQYLEKVEKEVLINALNMTHWNRTLAAKKLGMTFRSLRYRLKKFGLDTED